MRTQREECAPRCVQARAFWTSIPPLAIFVGHCVYCTTYSPQTRRHFLLNYWTTFLAGFGGGICSALLIMVRRTHRAVGTRRTLIRPRVTP